MIHKNGAPRQHEGGVRADCGDQTCGHRNQEEAHQGAEGGSASVSSLHVGADPSNGRKASRKRRGVRATHPIYIGRV